MKQSSQSTLTKLIGDTYPCEREGCAETFKAKKSWQKYHSRQCRDKMFNERRYVSVTGVLTPEQIATVRCQYSHPGVRQVR